jgi:hypothetical protein
MYILNYIDRNALPQTKVQGAEKEIGLISVQYNAVLSLTFIGYILMQGTELHGVQGIAPSSKKFCSTE